MHLRAVEDGMECPMQGAPAVAITPGTFISGEPRMQRRECVNGMCQRYFGQFCPCLSAHVPGMGQAIVGCVGLGQPS